jgi:hypothetical protein
MPDASLRQERLVVQFDFLLEPDGVAVTEHEGTATRSYRVPFACLESNPVNVTIWSKGKLRASVILLALSALLSLLQLRGGDVDTYGALVYAAAAAVAVLLFVRSRHHYIVVKGSPSLVVMRDRPSAAAVAAFLEQVEARRRAYVAEHFLLDTHEGALVDAMHKLQVLREQDSISDFEFETLKADIIRRAEEQRPPQASPN